MENKKDWTIMVYMSGDNNLSREMAFALQEIRDVAKFTEGKINLLVYFDSAVREVPTSYYDFTNYVDDYEATRADKVNRRFVSARNVDSLQSANENAAAMYSILNFIDWSVNQVKYVENGTEYTGRKADNYALIFSGHSFGFLNFGLFLDESSNYYMTLGKLRWALEDKLTEVLGQKLGILGFDSCVMSMLEVGYTFANSAETMIASEGTIPNTGWTYRKLIEKIVENTKIAPKELSKSLVYQFVKTHKNFTNGGVSIDMSAWDLVKVAEIVQPFELFIDNLINAFAQTNSPFYNQFKRVLLQVRWKCQPYMYDQTVDLIDFCKLLLDELVSLRTELNGAFEEDINKLIETCYNVVISAEDCILISGFCGGTNQFSNGISLFFPWTLNGYLIALDNYSELHFCSTSAGIKWNTFLLLYLTEVSFRPARNDVYGMTGIKNDKKSNEEVYFNKNIDLNNIKMKERIPPNIRDRIPPNILDRIPPNILDRIPPNIRDRIPPNILDRSPIDPSERGGFGGSGLGKFMSQFAGFRNVSSPWNISGLAVSNRKKKEDE